MRLINTQTLEMEELKNPVMEPYAILSHTWAHDNSEEVTFEDMQDLPIARSKKGFTKLVKAIETAVSNGMLYLWVDTCCIDKSSSAELSEAINSMFAWYKRAMVCYAYLEDLPAGGMTGSFQNFDKCRWFTRGWTLQELIAPQDLLFFDSEWNYRGAKEDMAAEIESLTGIDRWVLGDSSLLPTISLARRMSWASGRETSRVEDLAYCLMGIFDVNMAMIYGEGEKAFARLQQEILKKTTDLSLFAWAAKGKTALRGMLAETPAEFASCGTMVLNDDQFRFRDEISMTNKGVKINTALHYVADETYIMDLHCYREETPGARTRVGIRLMRSLDTYFRCDAHETAAVGRMPGDLPRPRFLISAMDETTMRSAVSSTSGRDILFFFPGETLLGRNHISVADIKAVPETYWHTNERQFFAINNLNQFRGFVRFSVTSRIWVDGPNRGNVSERSTEMICVCDLQSAKELQISLYAQTGLQSSPQPQGFICPFRNIEGYGPLGDEFSLSVLSPGEYQDRTVTIVHEDDTRHDYAVNVSFSMTKSTSFRVVLQIIPKPLTGPNTRPTPARHDALSPPIYY